MVVNFYYIIFNPAAGAGTALKVFKAVRKELDACKLSYDVLVSRYSGHTVKLAKQIGLLKAINNAALLVIGGDGTLNQAIRGLKMTTCTMPVAYIPAGSGNDFARGVGLSQDPMTALKQTLAATKPLVLDIGKFQEKTRHESGYFVNNIGVGFDGAVIAATDQTLMKRLLNLAHLGSAAYPLGVMKVFFTRKAFPVVVHANGKRTEIRKAFLVTTSNHPYFGGGIKILPMAVPTDGKLDLIVVEQLNTPYFLYLLLQLIRGHHMKYKAVHHFQSAHIQLDTPSVEFGQMDGEQMGTRPFKLDFQVAHQLFWFKPDCSLDVPTSVEK